MRPICTNLSEKLNQKINLITDDIRKIENKDLFKNNNENILVLENIRFYPEEEGNDTKFFPTFSITC
jgi:phosphoglycerate kinase